MIYDELIKLFQALLLLLYFAMGAGFLVAAFFVVPRKTLGDLSAGPKNQDYTTWQKIGHYAAAFIAAVIVGLVIHPKYFAEADAGWGYVLFWAVFLASSVAIFLGHRDRRAKLMMVIPEQH